MRKKIVFFLVLTACLMRAAVTGAQDSIRVKCDRFTMNVPSLNAKCYQIDENIPVEDDAAAETIANAQVASTAIYFSDYEHVMPLIPPQVTFYLVDDLGKTSFGWLDPAMKISDAINNINAGYMYADSAAGEISFLPYQAEQQVFNALPVKIDFEGGSGIRTITGFRETISSGSTNSNLMYSFRD